MFKKRTIFQIIALILTIALFGTCCAFAKNTGTTLEDQLDVIYLKYKDQLSKEEFLRLEAEYRKASIDAEQSSCVLLTTLDVFLASYNNTNIPDYAESFPFIKELIYNTTEDDHREREADRSGGDKWYYNTGMTLNHPVSYALTDMLSKVNYGDIVVESDASTQGLVGHAAIVEGVCYSSTYNAYYIRLIEAIDVGVCRSILDDDRYSDKSPYFYRVTSATTTQRLSVISFLADQIGKEYHFYFGHSSSPDNTTWYCSELVWAAYYNVGIDLLPGMSSGAVVLPYSLASSSYTTIVSITVY